jgi:multimeric flavodoxin WrbA
LTKRLLLITHAPSPNLQALKTAVLRGARHPDIADIEVTGKTAFDAVPDDVLAADGLILGTPENLAYMSGALKDFFDRTYYALIERTEGLPYALYIRSGQNGGDGTKFAVEKIVTGLRWRAVQAPLIMGGPYDLAFEAQCEELGLTMAAGLEAGVF